jgi:hypothetical protein
MPEIKCDHGHTLRVGTDEWLKTLTVDQLRYARDQARDMVKAAEDGAKRAVWRVCRGGLCVANYQEDRYDAAAAHLVRIFQDQFVEEAKRFLEHPYGTIRFEREVPHISVELVTQVEYDTEFFPAKP